METNNKIIAEFMGNRNYLYNNDKSARYFILTNTAGEELIVNYDNDWGLLMEVVEKIESLDSGIYTLIFQQKSCLIWNNDKGEELEFFNSSFKAETKIEAVYNACLEFIKWYNENSAKEK